MSAKIKSPLKAIRDKCLDCSGYSSKEVIKCEMTDCSLWPYRFGHMPKHRKSGYLSPLRAIRKKCLWCCNENVSEVNFCPEPVQDVCSLCCFRFGRNPYLKRESRNFGNSNTREMSAEVLKKTSEPEKEVLISCQNQFYEKPQAQTKGDGRPISKKRYQSMGWKR